MVPVFRDKRPERPDVMVLCDVSESVRSISRLMLAFVYTFQSLVRRARSFVFVSDLAEVTGLFQELELDAAVELAVSGEAVSQVGNSSYGQAFSSFCRLALASVTRRTTVIIIGDGRGNYAPSGADALGEIRRRCKRLLWICPEPQSLWGTGDSEMLRYQTLVNRALVVEDLDDLESLGDKLLPV
jgi:uncharacterized protein with von Willebrand factor type A (vWA) domain